MVAPRKQPLKRLSLCVEGRKFRPLAWPLKNVFIKAKIQMFSRILNAEWPSSIA